MPGLTYLEIWRETFPHKLCPTFFGGRGGGGGGGWGYGGNWVIQQMRCEADTVIALMAEMPGPLKTSKGRISVSLSTASVNVLLADGKRKSIFLFFSAHQFFCQKRQVMCGKTRVSQLIGTKETALNTKTSTSGFVVKKLGSL